MKKLTLFLIIILVLSCNNNKNNTKVSKDLRNYFLELNQFPGLTDLNGKKYREPKRNKTTGKRINVLDFGAITDDISFDNSSSFANAIESANPGDEVFIPSGKYYFNEAALFNKSYVAHISLKSGVNLVGEDRDKTVLISNFDIDTNRKYNTAVILSLGESDIIISDLTITSTVKDSEFPDPDISNINNFAGKSPLYGIVIDNNKPIEAHGNVLVNNLSIEGFQRMGIRIRTVRDVKISNTIIQNATDLGGGGAGYGISIQGVGNGADLTGSNIDTMYNIVENCNIKGPYLRHGILLQYYTHNNLITNNTITDTLLDSIDLHGEDEYNNEISYNTISNTRRGAGIGIGNSGATHDASGPNNYIHNNVITGGNRGIDILYGSPYSIITKNIINDISTEKSTGIFIQNGPFSYISENKIENFLGNSATGIKFLYSYNPLDPGKGIPDGLNIINNSIINVEIPIYVETHTNNFNFIGTNIIDDINNFKLPPISDFVIPKFGDLLLPTDDNFITTENRTYPQTQPNMKLKASVYDIPYNRMIYFKFNLTDINPNYKNVYLKLSGKSKDGLATLNIHGTTTYTEWNENKINWNNSLYHENNLAKTIESEDLIHITDFTFTTVGTEFNTYYIDVTDYIKDLEGKLVTIILSNDLVQNMYCEIYSKEVSAENYRPGLLFTK